MLSTFIIALREGLEASLIVSILVAYLVKTNNRKGANQVLWGVAIAVLTSVLVGVAIAEFIDVVPEGTNEIIAGLASIIAVFFVTWMIFWMSQQSRALKGELHKKIDLASTSVFTLVGVAFFAVIREGLETSLFVYTNFQTVQDIASPTAGLVLGFAVSITLGFLIYKSAIRLNLSKFFQYSGVALIIVAAGVLSYGVHEFQELGYLPGPDAFVWDVTSFIAKDSILGASLSGTIGFDTTTSWLQLGVWVLYLGAVLVPYLAKPKVTAKA